MRLVLLAVIWVGLAHGSMSSDLKQALAGYEAKDFEGARRHAESVLLSGSGEELEAALYLLVRINLATDQPERALKGANRLLSAFPAGSYSEHARFSRAESSYMLGYLSESRTDLQWCADSALDRRLAARSTEILNELSEFDPKEFLFPQDRADANRTAMGSEHRPRVMLLLSFPDSHDPAAEQLRESFLFSGQRLDRFDVIVSRVTSAFATVRELDRAVKEGFDLVAFAGDEGSAMSLALANAELEFPILKLTSTPRPLAPFSNGMVEFLPSQETQAVSAARYAGLELNITHGLLLTPESDIGEAHRTGFGRCEDFGLKLDGAVTYPGDALSIRPELYDLLSSPDRVARGGEVVEAVLSREEREHLFGAEGGGETSVPPMPENSPGSEAMFLSLSGEQIVNFCTQLGRVPRGMTLIGNSSWLDERSLAGQAIVTKDMLIVAPLLPFADRETEISTAFMEQEDFDLTAWQLLGLDAGEFVAAVVIRQLNSGGEFADAARDLNHFSGSAVEVEISATGENRLARILRFDGSELKVVK